MIIADRLSATHLRKLIRGRRPGHRAPSLLLLLSLAVGRTLIAEQPPADEGSMPVQTQLQILTDLNIAEHVIEPEPFTDWCKPVLIAIRDRFQKDKSKRDVVLQITLHTKGKPDIEPAGRPALSDAEVKELTALVSAEKAPHTKLVDFTFRIEAAVNGGVEDKSTPLVPKLEAPDDRRFSEFKAATTEQRLAMLKAWVRDESIPLLAVFCGEAEPKFEGVRNLGKALEKIEPGQPIDVAALTDRNPDFWRAMMEMQVGNLLVPCARIALHLANGEVEQARRWLEMAPFFDNGKTGASRWLANMRRFVMLFDKDVNERVREGVALHDKGKYEEALKIYADLLKSYPGSAYARFEQFHTRRTQIMEAKGGIAEAQADWPEVHKAILACDPLYPSVAQAKGNVEGYRVGLRMEIDKLFKDRDRAETDLVRYADIALDLDAYGFAGFLYWNALTRIEPEAYGKRDLVGYFLYCLDRLGVEKIRENFEGYDAAALAKIAAERRKAMEESPMYRLFRKDAEEKKGDEPERKGDR
ncbi:hypothetical protein [Singulisphaera sp. PoT]|uniref:hypothetical protein n=1 Tax=Singulisphaera sp. PoT TaxID=3411797 RepID=UPI003BF4B948